MSARPAILFVDDEPHVLAGLRDMLRRRRRDWDMVFVVGGAAAIEALDARGFDVVVSDMRMPGVDGAAVLAHAHTARPAAARLVLSGYTDFGAGERACPWAERVLDKPCDAAELEAALGAALAARASG